MVPEDKMKDVSFARTNTFGDGGLVLEDFHSKNLKINRVPRVAS